MNCPNCGLVNPSEASRCDCGYDFSAGKLTSFPGWEISLGWQQKVAAFWSISWPAWIGSMGLVLLSTLWFPVNFRQGTSPVFAISGNVAFFVIQAFLTRRLIRKNYRSFRVQVVRGDGSRSRDLSVQEGVSVWLWIVRPQLALLLVVSVVTWFWGPMLPPATTRGFSSMSLWLRFLVVGPYAMNLALRQNYQEFRLVTHGVRSE